MTQDTQAQQATDLLVAGNNSIAYHNYPAMYYTDYELTMMLISS